MISCNRVKTKPWKAYVIQELDNETRKPTGNYRVVKPPVEKSKNTKDNAQWEKVLE